VVSRRTREAESGYEATISEREIDSAMRVLLAACGEVGQFGRVVRDDASGELQIVYAVRGRAAKQFLDACPRRL
jgi:hypothetical protein